jgi:protein required for attachment to host cells
VNLQLTDHANVTWILVARRDGATVFASNGRDRPLTVVHRIPHPDGRLRPRDIDTDRPGRAFDRGGYGRHAFSTEENSAERVEHEWAIHLARYLDNYRATNAYDRLVLIAPPKLLGSLRDALPTPTQRVVVAELTKDLIDPDGTEVRNRLEGVVRL